MTAIHAHRIEPLLESLNRIAALEIVGSNFSFARTIGPTQNGNYLDSNQALTHALLRTHAIVVRGRTSSFLYPNLSQYAANHAQTVQSEPNGVFSCQQLRGEPERNHPFAKPPAIRMGILGDGDQCSGACRSEKSSWAKSIVLGTLIAGASFTLILWTVAKFMPKFLLIAESKWARVLPAISVLILSISGLFHYLHKRRK